MLLTVTSEIIGVWHMLPLNLFLVTVTVNYLIMGLGKFYFHKVIFPQIMYVILVKINFYLI